MSHLSHCLCPSCADASISTCKQEATARKMSPWRIRMRRVAVCVGGEQVEAVVPQSEASLRGLGYGGGAATHLPIQGLAWSWH